MSLFDAIGSVTSRQSQQNPMALMNSLRSNPIAFLNQQGYKVPSNLGSNPQQIVQYLIQSGQISMGLLNQVQSQLLRF